MKPVNIKAYKVFLALKPGVGKLPPSKPKYAAREVLSSQKKLF